MAAATHRWLEVPCTGSDMDVKLLEAQMKERFLNVIADVKKRAL